jgi:hypothetical protein
MPSVPIPDVDKIAAGSIRFDLQIDIFHSYLIGWRGDAGGVSLIPV